MEAGALMASGVRIENLRSFQSDLKRAEDASTREMTAALKKAGDPIVQLAGSLSPRGPTGRLRGSYRAQVRGTTGKIESSVPYGGGAEWGARGKFAGFNRYGAPGTRFAGRAVEEKADEVGDIIMEELKEIVTLHGWAS